MIARSIIFLTAWLSILVIVAGHTYDPHEDYNALIESNDRLIPFSTRRASEAHRRAASLHDEVGGTEHEEASRAHTRRADKFDAYLTEHETRMRGKNSLGKRKRGDENSKSLSNEDAFQVYNTTDKYLDKCWGSTFQAEKMVALLEGGHHQKALDGAPHRWNKLRCGVEPF